MAKEQENLDVDDGEEGEDGKIDTSQTDVKLEEKDEITEEATKLQDDFDKKLDEEGVDEITEPEEKDKEKEKTGEDKDTADKKASEDKIAADEKSEQKGDEEKVDDSELSDELLTKAIQYGLTMVEAKSFKSAAALETTLTHLERVAALPNTDNTDVDKSKADAKDKEAAPEFKPFVPKPLELKCENEDEIDESTTKSVKAMNEHNAAQLKEMNEHYEQQMKTMSDKLASVHSNVALQTATNFEKDFDTYVADTGDEYVKELGKGGIRSLDGKSTERANRMKVMNTMDVIDDTARKSGVTLSPEKEVFQQALDIVFKDKAKKMATEKAVSSLDKRSKQSIGKPSGKKETANSPIDKAIKTSKEFDAKIDAEEQ